MTQPERHPFPMIVVGIGAIGAAALGLGVAGLLGGGVAFLPVLARPEVAEGLVAVGGLLVFIETVILVRWVRERR